MKRGDLIEIIWCDPTTYAGHIEEPEKLTGSMVKTVGYLINVDSKYIRLSHSDYGSGGVADVTVVVRSLLIQKPRKIK